MDYDKLDEHADAFKDADLAFCCLGTTRAKAGKEGFVKVDYDYVVNSAQKLKDGGTCKSFHLLTSYGEPFLKMQLRGARPFYVTFLPKKVVL